MVTVSKSTGAPATLNTSLTCPIISGPMPSPGSMVTVCLPPYLATGISVEPRTAEDESLLEPEVAEGARAEEVNLVQTKGKRSRDKVAADMLIFLNNSNLLLLLSQVRLLKSFLENCEFLTSRSSSKPC